MAPADAGEFRQHLVSKVLINQWAEHRKVLAFDLDHPLSPAKRRTATQIGYKYDFIRAESRTWEARWSDIESHAPGALRSISDRSLFEHPALVDDLKDLFALHFARSRAVHLVWQRSLATPESRAHDQEIVRIISQDGALDELFLHFTGLVSPGTPLARQEALRRVAEVYKSQVGEGGTAFAQQVDDAWTQMRELLGRYSLEVGIPEPGAELLLSDSPVQPLDHATRTVGIVSGVSIMKADTIFMPVGPKAVLAAAKKPRYRMIPPAAVQSINAALIVSAYRRVFFRPSSSLETWVRASARRLRPESDIRSLS